MSTFVPDTGKNRQTWTFLRGNAPAFIASIGQGRVCRHHALLLTKLHPHSASG